MLRKGVKTLVIYLEDWQKRMIKDFLGVDCNSYEVEIGTSAVARPLYAVPTDESLKRMYFTDWQMREIRDEIGVVCEFIELQKSHIKHLYGIPADL